VKDKIQDRRGSLSFAILFCYLNILAMEWSERYPQEIFTTKENDKIYQSEVDRYEYKVHRLYISTSRIKKFLLRFLDRFLKFEFKFFKRI